MLPLQHRALHKEERKVSNSLVISDREISCGIYNGVDFGPRWWIIARSPQSMMVWIFGHSWTLNGSPRYAEPHLLMVPRGREAHHYVSFPELGWNRLTADRFHQACVAHPKFGELFPSVGNEDVLCEMTHAVNQRKTLIIEGGGNKLRQCK